MNDEPWNLCNGSSTGGAGTCEGLCEKEDGSVEFFDGDVAECRDCGNMYIVLVDSSGAELIEIEDGEYDLRKQLRHERDMVPRIRTEARTAAIRECAELARKAAADLVAALAPEDRPPRESSYVEGMLDAYDLVATALDALAAKERT